MRTLIGVVCCLLIASAASVAPAPIQQFTLSGPSLPGWVEKDVQVWDGTQWIDLGIGDITAPARAWMQDITTTDTSNREVYSMQLNHQVAVTQWMIWRNDGDGWYWGVRRPGIYTSGQVSAVARSNSDIELTFHNFDEAVSQMPNVTVNDTVEVLYALGYDVPPPVGDTAWHTPEELNQMSLFIYDSYDLHWTGFGNNMLAQINVSPCNSCGIYEDPDGAQVVATLQCMDPWIDPETGYFSGMPEFPY